MQFLGVAIESPLLILWSVQRRTFSRSPPQSRVTHGKPSRQVRETVVMRVIARKWELASFGELRQHVALATAASATRRKVTVVAFAQTLQ